MAVRQNPVLKIMRSDLPTPDIMLGQGYCPGLTEVKYYYDLINHHIFKDELKRPRIILKRLHGCWGKCEGYVQTNTAGNVTELFTKIILNKKQMCPQLCMVNLAHEMVHQYQWEVDGLDRLAQGKSPLMSHGPSFFAWRTKFRRFGVPLAVGHRALKIAYYQDIWAR